MKSRLKKIKKVSINRHKKCFEISTSRATYHFPFSKLMEDVGPGNTVVEAYVDPELANECITYFLEDGTEGALHLDSVLEVNEDPEYMKNLLVYNMTVRAIECVKQSGLSKREISRRLKTSPAQLYRLLDTANYSKSINQLLKLFHICGAKVDFIVK